MLNKIQTRHFIKDKGNYKRTTATNNYLENLNGKDIKDINFIK